MYPVYSLLLSLAFVVYLPVYAVKLRLIRGQRIHLLERLGWRLPEKPSQGKILWIHAVSVGEVLSLRNLTKQIKSRHPQWSICVSVLTETGFRIAQEKLEGIDRLFFVPFDFAMVVKRFFRVIRPQLLILAESEFWPNLLRVAAREAQGVVLINGRISQKSHRRYRRLRPFVRKVLAAIDIFSVQTREDESRLLDLGISRESVRISGNLKADIKLPRFTDGFVAEFRSSLGIRDTDKVVVAGSTHRGEERRLLEAYAQAKGPNPALRLVIAPRHPDRVKEIEQICESLSLRSQKKTAFQEGEAWEVMLLDTIGELASFYALADAAFVGGSLIPWGGQNLLEPAYYGRPIFFGPHMHNFSHLADVFLKGGAAARIADDQDLISMFAMADERELEAMGKSAQEILDTLRGATVKTVKILEDLMKDERA